MPRLYNNPYIWNWGWPLDQLPQQQAQADQQLQQQIQAVQHLHQLLEQNGYLNPVQVVAPVVQEVVEEPEEENIMLNKFRVGCDPEFMLLDADGKRIDASKYFPANGAIGYDHNGRLAEFRPGPTRGVYPIVKRIQELVKQANTIVPKRFRAGAVCNGDTLGGHVHFGFNPFQQAVPEDGNVQHGYLLNEKGEKATKALDALTKVLEHLDILPEKESRARRQHAQGYGKWGDVRNCKGHMEYRTMASWLYDPKVAFLCLTAAKLAVADPDNAYATLKNCQDFKTFETWLNNYKGADLNAARASEKLLDRGVKYLQVDPEVDFRERWERLGL